MDGPDQEMTSNEPKDHSAADLRDSEAHNTITIGLAEVSEECWLVLPEGIRLHPRKPKHIGSWEARAGHITRIYAVNKEQAPTDTDPIKFAYLRAAALHACGWGVASAQDKIIYQTGPDYEDACGVMRGDRARINLIAADAHKLALWVPLIAEYVFRTTGYVFNDVDATQSVEQYRRAFGICGEPYLFDYLPPKYLLECFLPWITPGMAWAVLQARMHLREAKGPRVKHTAFMAVTSQRAATEDTDPTSLSKTPNPTAVRHENNIPGNFESNEKLQLSNRPHGPREMYRHASDLPAGTEIIKETALVLSRMSPSQRRIDLIVKGGYDLEFVQSAEALIKTDPPRYHKDYHAYNLPPPSAREKGIVDTATQIAKEFAPVAEGVVSSGLVGNTPEIPNLRVYAEINPAMVKRARRECRAW